LEESISLPIKVWELEEVTVGKCLIWVFLFFVSPKHS
jgi:hypothetical protein